MKHQGTREQRALGCFGFELSNAFSHGRLDRRLHWGLGEELCTLLLLLLLSLLLLDTCASHVQSNGTALEGGDHGGTTGGLGRLEYRLRRFD